MKILNKYKNGNVDITLYEDGTKVREWEGDATIEVPESVDLKVTQFCDLDHVCVFCHEMSNKQGKHGNLQLIEKIWDTQLPGTEIAIGGGNCLAHPDIDQFLFKLSRKGIIPNITMNTLHLKRHAKQIRDLQGDKCVYGLGISYRGEQYLKNMPLDIDYSYGVFHLILGLNDYDDCKAVIKWCKENQVKPKILLLGYKQFGNGVKHYSPELQLKIDEWKVSHLPKLMNEVGLTLSFDNLAIKQLNLQTFMNKEQWDTFYMGMDGTITAYCDSVKEEFAKTSTSTKRYSLENINNVRQLIQQIHEEIRNDQ